MATQAELRARLEAINAKEKQRRAQLAERKAKLQAQLRALARPTKSQRRLDARRKILVGAFVLDQLEGREQKPAELEFLGKRFADWLVRDTDRACFGLPPTAPPAAGSAPSPTTVTTAPGARTATVDTPLHVPFPEKDQVKALGAHWHAASKTWVVPAGADLTPFSAWLTPR